MLHCLKKRGSLLYNAALLDVKVKQNQLKFKIEKTAETPRFKIRLYKVISAKINSHHTEISRRAIYRPSQMNFCLANLQTTVVYLLAAK